LVLCIAGLLTTFQEGTGNVSPAALRHPSRQTKMLAAGGQIVASEISETVHDFFLSQ
jgi:hypothetical protein